MPRVDEDDWTAYFEAGEKLLWTGSPESDRRLRWSQIGMAIFGAPFLIVGVGLCGASVWGILTGEADTLWKFGMAVFLILFSLPFAAAGLFLVAGPSFKARYAPHYVRYALSTRRAYIAESWWSRQLKTYPLRPDMRVDLVRDGLDSVILYSGSERDSDGDLVTVAVKFEQLADGRPLYHLVRQLQSGMTDVD